MMKKTGLFLAVGVLSVFSSYTVLAHCQVPCGIYGDTIRFSLLKEHVQTIEKSMLQIKALEKAETVDSNQLIRWVKAKDDHADKLTDIVTYYFLAQRVKPVADGPERAAYLKKLELLHAIMVHSMKAKQGTDTAHTDALASLIGEFEKLYFGKTGQEHGHTHGDDGHTH